MEQEVILTQDDVDAIIDVTTVADHEGIFSMVRMCCRLMQKLERAGFDVSEAYWYEDWKAKESWRC